MKYEIIKPSGYCPGVRKAIDLLLISAENSNKNTITLGRIINNEEIVQNLANKGIRTFETNVSNHLVDIKSFSSSDLVVFGAHGHNHALDEYLDSAGIPHLDLCCPIILNIYKTLYSYVNKGYLLLLVGKKGHQETEAYLSNFGSKIFLYDKTFAPINELSGEKILIFAQTTISEEIFKNAVNNIKEIYPDVEVLDSLCKVPLQRQKAVANLDDSFDLIIVVGSVHSSNTIELFNVAKSAKGKNAIMIYDLNDAINQKELISRYKKAAILSGSSSSDSTIESISAFIEKL